MKTNVRKSYRFDYGFAYEYGYNIGLFAALIQMQKKRNLEINPKIQHRLTKLLEKSEQNLSNFIVSFRKKHNITDEAAFEVIRKNIEHIFFFGYLSGNHAMRSYIQSFPDSWVKTKVVYFQINVIDPLNMHTNHKVWNYSIKHDIYHAFNYRMEEIEIDSYKKKGHFLNADSIVLLQQGKTFYLLVTDNGLNLHHLEGVFDPKQLLRNLKQIRSEMGKKTKFSHLAMDTSGIENIQLHRLLLKYVDVVKDKTLKKIVQAGSYAYSFLKFIEDKVPHIGTCYASIMGKVDYDFSIVNLHFPLKDWDQSEGGLLLKKCHEEYKNQSRISSESERKEIPRVAKEILLKNMIQHTNIDREELWEFVKNVKGIYSIKDKITGFQSTAGKFQEEETLRDDHAIAVREGLTDNERRILFLTGNPGIGKTTEIVKALKKYDRFMFLYASCRRAVNDDILLKFEDESGGRLFADDLIALSTSYTDEQTINGKPVSVVNVYINDEKKVPAKSKLTYLSKKRSKQYEKESISFRYIGDNEFVEDIQFKTKGVLKRLCDGIAEQFNNPNIRKIIGTFSIQALKRTREETTIQHIKKLFPFVRYSYEMGVRIDNKEFDRFVEKYPVCWIMIDEITGADEGIDLYQFFKAWLFDQIYAQLDAERRAKWNLKLIIADASITNETIIQLCLNKKVRFDHPKIYVTDDQEDCVVLHKKDLTIPIYSNHSNETIKGWFVNANSYPAKELELTYHISVQGITLEEYLSESKPNKGRLKKEWNLAEEHDERILDQIFEHLKDPSKSGEQVIVYIQNINRIEVLKNRFIERYRDCFGEEAKELEHYMTITSQLNEKTREDAIRVANRVRCVFITSSASRGISFKNATKLLVVLQTFNIERELMEQIQLYYRMRGHKQWDHSKVKSIEFFLVDSYIHNLSDEDYYKSKTAIHILSFLTLVRSCLVSRIFGRAQIGTQSLSLVPLGGRGISPVKKSIIQDIADSMKLITKELAGKGNYQLLRELNEEFSRVFGHMEIRTSEQIFQPGYTKDNVYRLFRQYARKNMSQLIEFEPFCSFLFVNGLIIFRINDEISQRVVFLVQERKRNEKLAKKLRQVMKKEITDDLRKKLLHIIELLEYEHGKQGPLPNTYVEDTKYEKRYVAIPVLAFVMIEALRTNKPATQGAEESFLEVLQGLVQLFTDATSITPVSGEFVDLPFITFKSDALQESFDSWFKQNHLLTSTETNILNLLLLEGMK